MTRLLILGGSDAGISAALRAKEVNATSEVTVVLADRFPNYSICGLPFYLSGEVPDWHWLAHRTAEEITGVGIRLLLEHTAQMIDPLNHVVTVVERNGQAEQLRYDRLVIATGAEPVRPPIRGLDLAGVYVLRSMEDSFAVHAYLESQTPRTAVIIGGGYIGLEMADALTHRGLSVSVVEHGASVLKNFDISFGQHIGAELQTPRRPGYQSREDRGDCPGGRAVACEGLRGVLDHHRSGTRRRRCPTSDGSGTVGRCDARCAQRHSV